MKKVLIGIGILFGIVVLLFVGFIGTTAYLRSQNNSYKGDYIKTFNSDTADKKALLVFQPSNNSTSADIAEQIALGLNNNGYQVTLTYPGKHISEDVKDYTLLVFGSPVFASSPSSAVTEYISGLKNSEGKKIAVYSVGSMDEMPELDELTKSLKSTSVIQKTKFKVNDKNVKAAALKFGQDLGK